MCKPRKKSIPSVKNKIESTDAMRGRRVLTAAKTTGQPSNPRPREDFTKGGHQRKLFLLTRKTLTRKEPWMLD